MVETMSNQAHELSKRYKMILPERRGHGRTADFDGELTYRDMAEDTVALMHALDIPRAVLCGYSDGADVALQVAVSHPELVKGLVLISGNSNIGYMSERDRSGIRSMTMESVRRFSPELVENYLRVVPDAHEKFPRLLEKTKKLWLSDWEVTAEELASISCPTLVMSGDRDAIPLSHTLDIFNGIKGARLCVVPGATHSLIDEKPALVNLSIMDFIGSMRD